MLHVNHAFVLDMAQRLKLGGRILDYGCGAGTVVEAGLKRGVDIYGTDIFYGGVHGDKDKLKVVGLLGTRVLQMKDGRIPFPDNSFDFVFHNQVFEHVEKLEPVLAEIARVLKGDGVMLSLFPSREVIREGHWEIPFSHRFSRQSKIGHAYVRILRECGLGKDEDGKSPAKWTRDTINWIHDWCYYRPLQQIVAIYTEAGFSFERTELDYIVYRLKQTSREWAVPLAAAFPSAAAYAFSKLAGMVILSRKIVSDSADR